MESTSKHEGDEASKISITGTSAKGETSASLKHARALASDIDNANDASSTPKTYPRLSTTSPKTAAEMPRTAGRMKESVLRLVIDIQLVRWQTSYYLREPQAMESAMTQALIQCERLGDLKLMGLCHYRRGIARMWQDQLSEALEDLNEVATSKDMQERVDLDEYHKVLGDAERQMALQCDRGSGPSVYAIQDMVNDWAGLLPLSCISLGEELARSNV